MGNFQAVRQFAQGITEGIAGAYQPVVDLEQQVASLSARIVIGSAVALIILVVIAALLKNSVPKLKLPLFLMIASIMAGSTLFLAGSTVYVNVKSDSGGPVHWHADIEIWACGNELEVRDPFEFLSNKIGTSTLHEHNDRRIHLEGVVVDDSRDASLGKYFHVIDGVLTSDALVVPLNPEGERLFEDDIDGDGPSENNAASVQPFLTSNSEGKRYFKALSGQNCGSETAYVQTFVYTYNEADKTYEQKKIVDPVPYVISPYSTVPAGDCIIVEFDVLKSQTNKLCAQYGIRDIDRCEQFGIEPDQRSICTLKQTNYPADDPNQENTEPASQVNAAQTNRSELLIPEGYIDGYTAEQRKILSDYCASDNRIPGEEGYDCSALKIATERGN